MKISIHNLTTRLMESWWKVKNDVMKLLINKCLVSDGELPKYYRISPVIETHLNDVSDMKIKHNLRKKYAHSTPCDKLSKKYADIGKNDASEFRITFFSVSSEFLEAMSQGIKRQKIDEFVEKSIIGNEKIIDNSYQFVNESVTDSSVIISDNSAKSDNPGVTDSSISIDSNAKLPSKPSIKRRELPKGIKNVDASEHHEVERTDYSKCIYLEGKFFIKERQWKNLTMAGGNLSNERNNYRKCRNFKFEISDDSHHAKIVEVYSTSRDYCHPHKISGQVRGVERDLTKNVLRKIKPAEYRKKTILRADRNAIKRGQLQDVKSEDVVRKIRSEAMNNLKQHEDDMVDMYLYKKYHNNFIQQLCSSLNVKMFSLEQLEIAKTSSTPIWTLMLQVLWHLMVSISTQVEENDISQEVNDKELAVVIRGKLRETTNEEDLWKLAEEYWPDEAYQMTNTEAGNLLHIDGDVAVFTKDEKMEAGIPRKFREKFP
ncbi:unnamed protein product [Phaedon cochleariae]|uniref:Uncharacterized protein n=1 Tax=Phaedon cochleariae TaxID=80249 RepID=A0A9N9SNM1_PHACE|nr:unnamed protein product [Phaedon cochleariae]